MGLFKTRAVHNACRLRPLTEVSLYPIKAPLKVTAQISRSFKHNLNKSSKLRLALPSFGCKSSHNLEGQSTAPNLRHTRCLRAPTAQRLQTALPHCHCHCRSKKPKHHALTHLPRRPRNCRNRRRLQWLHRARVWRQALLAGRCPDSSAGFGLEEVYVSTI